MGTGYKKGANGNHSTPADREAGGKNTGSHDFSKVQPPVRREEQHGKSNGSRGTTRVISPGSVRGSNR